MPIYQNICKIGLMFIASVEFIGRFILFLLDAVKKIFTKDQYYDIIFKRFLEIGFNSLFIIAMTSFFAGAVLALQSYSGFSKFNAESSIPIIVVLSITRELGPVLGGLMLTARIGSAIAAEIASMRVSEQIDALQTLSVNPIKYIVSPRIIAVIFAMPLLIIIADIFGVMGGYAISVYYLHFSSGNYINATINFVESFDVISGMIKSSIFGLTIVWISCFTGFYAKNGASGVGKATIQAVTTASIAIFILNYILTAIMF